MEPDFKIVWVTYTNDGCGRSVGEPLGYYSSMAAAEESVRGKGWYGGNGNVDTKYVIGLNGKWYILESIQPIDIDRIIAEQKADLRRRTIANLSDEQLDVLGLRRD